jgi:protein-S-isoprenylcysteine O-methyltransferase Ste14
MNTQLAILIISSIIWIVAETYLIFIDKAQGKGKTLADKRTRNFNTISIALTFILVPAIFLFPVFGFATIRISIIFWIGFAFQIIGFFLRYWSIYTLGKYFRTTIEIEKGQKVIEKGPYKYIRHPSYSGIILFCFGYGLVSLNWISIIIAVLLPAIALLYRIHNEESILVNEIGKVYEDYMKRTKRLIPGIW